MVLLNFLIAYIHTHLLYVHTFLHWEHLTLMVPFSESRIILETTLTLFSSESIMDERLSAAAAAAVLKGT